MLELKEITKTYRVADNDVTVLKGISLRLRNSEFVSILGPSGCGKTTMLNIIGGLDKYTTGDLVINGKSTKEYKDGDWDTYRNHSIGFVFQSYNLIPHQSVLKNVELALSIGGISRAERIRRAKEVLIKVGLEDHIYKKPNQLSGGQCQRVSIARALVNNPDIILADEPTGALDTETSVQVMDLLKEIASERLVLMVTHNPELAERYSTRIVKMLDGNITSDSNPIDDEEYEAIKQFDKEEEEKTTPEEKKQARKKASMSVKTSIGLSASNLMTKKKRTFITAFASAIGIIGIAVILSVSTGMSAYVDVLEQDSSSSNFIQIDNTSAMSLLTEGFQGEQVELEEYPEVTDGVYVYTQESLADNLKKQTLSDEYVSYIEENVISDIEARNLVLGIKYTRSVGINLISKVSDTEYKQVVTDNWTELLNNPEYIGNQFTIVSGEKMPTEYNEISLVVDKYNRISTDILDALGVAYEDGTTILSFDKFVGKEFSLVKNDDYYVSHTMGSKQKFTAINTNEEYQVAYNNGIKVKIVSIIRQIEDASSMWAQSGIAYTEGLTDKVLEINSNSNIVNYQREHEEYNVLTGNNFMTSNGGGSFGGIGGILGFAATYDSNMVNFGGDTKPSSIVIYPKDFDSKEQIIAVLDNWNNTKVYELYGTEKDADGNDIAEAYKVEYMDVSELLASMLGDLIDIITYALIAFSSVSLVVSSIMIAIITYASVIERTKEIGTIRSLGGRKRDVSVVFIAEACIIGLVSAIIAIITTLCINAIINIVLFVLVGVSSIASLDILTALGMIGLSVGLNLLASLIPSRLAAKKDPVVALRTE